MWHDQVEVLSAVVNSIANTVKADAIVDVGAGQVCSFFLSSSVYIFMQSTWNLGCLINSDIATSFILIVALQTVWFSDTIF